MNWTRISCLLAPGIHIFVLSSDAFASESMIAPAAEAPEVTTSEATMPTEAKADIKTLVFKTRITAPVEEVWDTMLSPEGYREWTAPFATGSYFEGSWSEGERIHFLAPGGSGMLAVIAANRQHEFLSIKHIGYVMNGVEDTTSDGVQSWAPAYEKYRFTPVADGTEVAIEQEVLVDYEDYMNNTWPKALAALKALCEAN